jgi:RNA polymerase sigma factor (sigma-70 family)
MSTTTIAFTLPGGLDPGELVDAARNGCPGAMEQLVDRYAGVVWSAARSYGLREVDVHDAVQNTWLRMIEHLNDVRDPERLPGWLATTARRECLKILRGGRREVVGLEPAVVEQAERATPGPERDVIDRSMHGLLWTRVAELPPAGRQMVTALTGADAPSYQDYARETGMPIGSIGPRRMRYLQQLRRLLEGSGLGSQAWR